MSAISATRRAMKELVDGTIRVSLDIDPQYRDEFLANFSRIDMPVAIAPLVSDFERAGDPENGLPEASKEPAYTGLTKLAIEWCKDEQFWEWLNLDPENAAFSERGAAACVKGLCCIESRKELNTDPHAAASFNQHIRAPYMQWLKEKGLGQS